MKNNIIASLLVTLLLFILIGIFIAITYTIAIYVSVFWGVSFFILVIDSNNLLLTLIIPSESLNVLGMSFKLISAIAIEFCKAISL